MPLHKDLREFIASLNSHHVDYLIVGAFALAFHGVPRYTGDIDILIRPTHDNARRVLAAIASFGFPVSELSPDHLIDPRRMLEMGASFAAPYEPLPPAAE